MQTPDFDHSFLLNLINRRETIAHQQMGGEMHRAEVQCDRHRSNSAKADAEVVALFPVPSFLPSSAGKTKQKIPLTRFYNVHLRFFLLQKRGERKAHKKRKKNKRFYHRSLIPGRVSVRTV